MNEGRFIVYVDKERYSFDQDWVTAREILIKAQKDPPDRYRLFRATGDEELTLKQRVDLVGDQENAFKTLPRDQTEG